MAAVSDDSSDSIDEETLRRCQEAVWETKTVKNKDRDNGVQPSRRVIVSDHEHDGNELQVTQGFRKHVAKKLENLLDSVLTVTSSSCVESERRDDDDDDDEGFRLFSTSVPGPTTDNGPAPARRQPVPSSSDSDSEMETRLKEAAVSITDLVPLISSMPSACLENIQKMDDVVDEEEKKKKKKRAREGSPPNTNLEQENVRVKVKRKKKKKRDANTEEEAAN